MKSRLFASSPVPFSTAAPLIPRLFSNAHRAETLRQLQQADYQVSPQKLPKIQEERLGFSTDMEETSMPWVAERGMVVHQVYGAFLRSNDPFMLTNVGLSTVTERARNLGHPVVGKAGADRPDGVSVRPPLTSATPLVDLVELKPAGTALTGEGPAQVAGYKKALEDCGLQTSLMSPASPLANTVLPVPGYGEMEFEGMQEGIVGYRPLRRSPQTVPEVVPLTEEITEPQTSLWQHLRQLAEAIEVGLEVALGVALLLVAIVILSLLVPLPPPVPA